MAAAAGFWTESTPPNSRYTVQTAEAQAVAVLQALADAEDAVVAAAAAFLKAITHGNGCYTVRIAKAQAVTLLQALADAEEAVVAAAAGFLTAITQRGLLAKRWLLAAVAKVSPRLLRHPAARFASDATFASDAAWSAELYLRMAAGCCRQIFAKHTDKNKQT